MAEPTHIRIHPVWRETPDYALLALALIHLAEQLQERERQAAAEPSGETGEMSREDEPDA